MLTSLFLLSALLLIRVFWILNDDTVCVETKLGQEMYRLLIFYFFITIILNMIVETIWSFLYFKGGLEEWLPEPEFDIRNGSVLNNLRSTSSFFSLSYNHNQLNHLISRNTTNLIYCQLVTGLGYYYSPLLPLVTSITLIITFYLQFYLCRFNFKLSKEILQLMN